MATTSGTATITTRPAFGLAATTSWIGSYVDGTDADESDVDGTTVVGTTAIGTSVVNSGPTVAAGIDVEFSKIAQIDAGDPAKNLAPAYRVWFHNNSTVDITQPFDVAILASTDGKLAPGLAYSNVRVDGLAADESTSVDIRLPVAAMSMKDSDGQTAPYAFVHTIIDSQKELVETNKTNNLSCDSRDEIPAVDAGIEPLRRDNSRKFSRASDGRQFHQQEN